MEKRVCLNISDIDKTKEITSTFFEQVASVVKLKESDNVDFEITTYNLPKEGERIEILSYRDQPIAIVTTTKDQNGSINLTLFKNTNDLRKTILSNHSP